jgi:drug/metabolite transporter (DMT)-like permease
MQSSRLPWAVFTACCLIWGSTWLAIKAGLETLPPFTFVGLRYIIATIALAAIVKLMHTRFPRDRLSWGIMLFLGILQMSLPYGLVFWGEQYISSGLASILFATNPFFVVIFANFIVRNEKMTLFKTLGVSSSFLGLLIVFLPDVTGAQNLATQTPLLGGLALVGSAALSGLSSVIVKRFASHIQPATNVFVQSSIAAVVLSCVGLLTEANAPKSFTLTTTVAVIYLAVFGSAAAFVGQYWLLRKTTATNVSMMAFITPIVALILGWIILQEVPSLYSSVGGALILAGVYLTTRPVRRV